MGICHDGLTSTKALGITTYWVNFHVGEFASLSTIFSVLRGEAEWYHGSGRRLRRNSLGWEDGSRAEQDRALKEERRWLVEWAPSIPEALRGGVDDEGWWTGGRNRRKPGESRMDTAILV